MVAPDAAARVVDKPLAKPAAKPKGGR